MSNDMINEKEFKQLCRLLQIQTDVTIRDLRKAYYRLAKSCHPDKHPNDESATTHFILVSRAYKTLCNQLDYKNNNNNKTKNASANSTKSSSQEKRCSIAEQFLSDLKRQDLELSHSTKAYNENKNAHLPIDKLLNHLLEATLLTEGNSKGRTSEKQKTYNPRERLVKSGRPRSTASFGLNQQQYTARTSQHNDKSIVPYSIDNKQVVVKTPSEELHNECSIHTKHSDLITDDWISEAQNILDNIKSTRRLSHSTCTPCLNTQYNSDINKTHLLPVIDNPDMMRCLICYRTFKFDTAIKHVEICLRKSQTNKDNGMNSLGSTVATGYSPVTIRAKQYIENLQKRRTNSFTTSGVCVEPKNENQKRKSETELLKLKKS